MSFINKDTLTLLDGKHPKNILNEYEIRVLYEPCRMCRPAIIGCEKVLYGFDYYENLLVDYKESKKVVINPKRDEKEPFIMGK